MLDNSTIETLKAMHCSAMASELENQLNDSKTYGTLAFEERIALMVMPNGTDANRINFKN